MQSRIHIFTQEEFLKYFEINQETTLGTGHDSIVYLVKNINTQQQYALKCCIKFTTKLINIQNEINILCQTQHPHIIKLVGYSNDYSCILLEYMAYGSLRRIINQGFSEAIAKSISSKLLDALRYLHYNHIIHSDIKPENTLIAYDFKVKICDFGFSRQVPQQIGAIFGGSEGFFAPEVYMHSQNDLIKCDIFSLAVTMFIFVTGQKPFLSSNPRKNDNLWRLIYEEKWPDYWSNQEFSQASINFKQLFQKMISPDPKLRSSIDEIQQSDWIKSDMASEAVVVQELEKRLKILEQQRQQQNNQCVKQPTQPPRSPPRPSHSQQKQ